MSAPVPAGFKRKVFSGSAAVFLLRDSFARDLEESLARNPPLFDELPGKAQRGKVREFRTLGGYSCVLRRYVHGGFFGGLLKDLHWGWGRALHEVRISEMARERGLHTPEIVGIRARQAWGPFWRLELITRKIEAGLSCEDFLRSLNEPRSVRQLLGQVAGFVRKMHDAGLVHADLHARNLLVCPSRPGEPSQIVVLDLDRGRFVERLSPAAAAGSLFRLNRSLEKFGVGGERVTVTDRLRFLHAYWGEGESQSDATRQWLRQCERHLQLHRLWWKLCGRPAS